MVILKTEEEKEQVKEVFDCNCAIVGLALQFGSLGDKDNTKNGGSREHNSDP